MSAGAVTAPRVGADAALSADTTLGAGWPRWAVFAGFPVGIGVVGGLILLILGGAEAESGGAWFSRGWTPVLVFAGLLLPYSIAGGALEGLYGRRPSWLPCCSLVILGATVAYLLPLAGARLAGLYVMDTGLVAAVAGGLAAQVAAAVVAWALTRRRAVAQG